MHSHGRLHSSDIDLTVGFDNDFTLPGNDVG